MSAITQEMKEQAIAAYKAGESAPQVALRFGVSDSTIYNWAKFGARQGAQSIANLKAKRNTNRQRAIAGKSTLREALYNQVKDEYQATESHLKDLHAKLKFLGEDWNADTIQ